LLLCTTWASIYGKVTESGLVFLVWLLAAPYKMLKMARFYRLSFFICQARVGIFASDDAAFRSHLVRNVLEDTSQQLYCLVGYLFLFLNLRLMSAI
jgi:hypothetical protein